jgi:hypothetical protein
MAQSTSVPLAPATVQERVSARATAIPWYVWCCIAAVSSSAIGGVWDISWHKSVGRDSFWTPAHMLIYLCGVLAGITCGYLILSTTLQKNSPMREASISMWGFRGPLGAFICAWGGVAMITSAPFDNWWHGAYGLDVKILSPPHILLALGMTAIRFGTLVMVVAAMNRAQGELRARLERVLFYAFVFLLAMTIGIAEELTNRVYMHGAKFYVVVMLGLPIWLAAVARVSKHRWAATIMTGLYTALHLAFMWVLPLAVSGAEARAGVSENYAPGSTGFSAAADRAGYRVRSAAAAHRHVEPVDAGRNAGRGDAGEFCCGAVAVCGFSDVAGIAQPVFRYQ